MLIHKNTYNALSSEYEAMVENLRPVTEDSTFYFTPHIKSIGKIVDIGCGVGLVVNVLNERGFPTTGIEISPKMANYARKRNSASDVIVGGTFSWKNLKKNSMGF